MQHHVYQLQRTVDRFRCYQRFVHSNLDSQILDQVCIFDTRCLVLDQNHCRRLGKGLSQDAVLLLSLDMQAAAFLVLQSIIEYSKALWFSKIRVLALRPTALSSEAFSEIMWRC